MTKSEYLADVLQRILGDTATNTETLKKLYGRTKLFTLEDVENAYDEGNKSQLMWWVYLLCIVFIFVILVFLNIALGLIKAFYFRKCPICGKRMVHEETINNPDGDAEKYIFSCHHCGDIEEVTPIQIAKETV